MTLMFPKIMSRTRKSLSIARIFGAPEKNLLLRVLIDSRKTFWRSVKHKSER